MDKKITIDDKEYDLEKFSSEAKGMIAALQFTDNRIKELLNMKALLQRAKNSYLDSLKKEIISDKAGVLFRDD